jgi:hypothetical protein
MKATSAVYTFLLSFSFVHSASAGILMPRELAMSSLSGESELSSNTLN